MTELNRLFRAGAFAGLLLSTAAVSVAQQATPPAMPRPRYQSPAVPQIPEQAPTPQYNLPQTAAITPNAVVVEDVIVRVNDQIISRSDVERSEVQLQQELAQNRGAAGDPEERQKNLLRDLIDQQLLLSKGKELSINADAEVIRRLDEIRKQNNLPTMEALEAAARSQGVSFEDFKATIRNGIITGQVVRDEVGRNLHMTRADELKYYEAHKAEFEQPEQVRLSEILVPTAANADDAQIAAALKSSQEIYDKLKAGADFAATAKASSGGPTAAQGGDLGLFKHGALAPVLETKTFALPVGGFTEPTRTRQGYVILKAVEHQQAGTPPLEQVENEVQNAMYQEAIQPALRAYLTRLREEAFIDLRAGFVDSGASPKQTKPVFASYVAPTPKKKVDKQRMDAAATGRLAQQRTTAVAAATPVTQELDKHGKPKKVKREKIRYGQAPRTALPDAPESADVTTTDAAPGTSISPLQGSGNTIAANAPDEDTTAANAAPRVKTRYASREVEVKVNQRKVEAKTAKIEEKAKATPIAATTDEQQTHAAQAGALGLNGSNAKPAKVKRKKGDPKERIQEKPIEKAAPLNDNGLPDRLHQVNAPTRPDGTKANSDSTTLPPANQPAPGSTTPSPVPSPNGTAQPVPQQ